MQTYEVVITARAWADLLRIRRYISQDNPAAATRLAVQLMAACDRLDHMPERGRPGLQPGTRELVTVWPYLIVYRIKEGRVRILRIWDGRRDRS